MDAWPEGVKAWYERLRALSADDVELRPGTGSRYEILARTLVKNEYLELGELALAPPPDRWVGFAELRSREREYLAKLITRRGHRPRASAGQCLIT